MDFVANHISNRHPAFISAAADPDSPTRDWFYFREYPRRYFAYYDIPELPILNSENPAVRDYLATRGLSLAGDGMRRVSPRPCARREPRLLVGVSCGDACCQTR